MPRRPTEAELKRRTVTAFRRAFREAISIEDVEAIARKMSKLAVDGDMQAINSLLDRVIGKAGTYANEPVQVQDLVSQIKAMGDTVPLAPSLREDQQDD